MSESPTDYASMAFGSSRRGFMTPTSDSRRPFKEYEIAETERFKAKDIASERAIQDVVSRHGLELKEHESEARERHKQLLDDHEMSLSGLKSEIREARAALCDVTDRECEVSEEVTLLRDRVRHEETECASFRESYLMEANKRRALQTELVDLRGNIRVLCRVRPMLPFEIKNEGKGNECIRFPFATTTDDGIVDVEDRKGRNRFEFDAVFRQGSTQRKIFQQVNPLVMSALDGFNVCIFAYGQTGSGKTYTMIGDRGGDGKGRGVYSRSFEALFEMSKERELTMDAKYEFRVSLMEIYNETVRDLLADPDSVTSKSGLHIVVKKQRRSPRSSARSTSPRAGTVSDGVVVIEDLTIENVNSIEEMRDAIRRGARARAVGAHCVNERSSRSHLVVTVYVRGRCGDRETNAKLHLIDLAGSERLAKTGASGQLLKEAKFINKSLSALGDVISALSEQKKHVPFRNSKLTFSLQDSLSGNSKVLMFVNCSPARSNSSETTCSLRFAARCRKCALGKARANVKCT